MDDLIFRLRDSAKYYKHYSNIPTLPIELNEAADEIERLRRQHKELKAAAWDVEKAFLHNQGSMDRAIDTLSDLLQELEEK